jgi:hypothetical protein
MNLNPLIVRGIFPAVLSILLVGARLVVSASGSEPSMETVRAEAERGGYRLIATDELAELYVNGDKDRLLGQQP